MVDRPMRGDPGDPEGPFPVRPARPGPQSGTGRPQVPVSDGEWEKEVDLLIENLFPGGG